MKIKLHSDIKMRDLILTIEYGFALRTDEIGKILSREKYIEQTRIITEHGNITAQAYIDLRWKIKSFLRWHDLRESETICNFLQLSRKHLHRRNIENGEN